MRTKRILSLLLSLVIIAGLAACGYKESEPKQKPAAEIWGADSSATVSGETSDITPLLYKVTDSYGNVAYLFGSIHVGYDKMYPLPDYVINAYEQSDVLAVECDIVAYEEDPSDDMEFIYSFLYTDGTTISDHIDRNTYKAAVRILEQNDSYNTFMDYYTPYLWADLINSFMTQDSRYTYEYGIDRHFIHEAYDDNKTIDEIESVEFQQQMMINFSPDLQEMLLQSAVEDYNSGYHERQIRELVNTWCSGNENELIKFAETDVDDAALSEREKQLLQEYNNAVLVERNLSMTDYAEAVLASGDTVFICVGSAHVVGDGGMTGLLRSCGYTVEAVN